MSPTALLPLASAAASRRLALVAPTVLVLAPAVARAQRAEAPVAARPAGVVATSSGLLDLAPVPRVAAATDAPPTPSAERGTAAARLEAWRAAQMRQARREARSGQLLVVAGAAGGLGAYAAWLQGGQMGMSAPQTALLAGATGAATVGTGRWIAGRARAGRARAAVVAP